jgi:hypothetical protein
MAVRIGEIAIVQEAEVLLRVDISFPAMCGGCVIHLVDGLAAASFRSMLPAGSDDW